jgi:hypothetical protein
MPKSAPQPPRDLITKQRRNATGTERRKEILKTCFNLSHRGRGRRINQVRDPSLALAFFLVNPEWLGRSEALGHQSRDVGQHLERGQMAFLGARAALVEGAVAGLDDPVRRLTMTGLRCP